MSKRIINFFFYSIVAGSDFCTNRAVVSGRSHVDSGTRSSLQLAPGNGWCWICINLCIIFLTPSLPPSVLLGPLQFLSLFIILLCFHCCSPVISAIPNKVSFDCCQMQDVFILSISSWTLNHDYQKVKRMALRGRELPRDKILLQNCLKLRTKMRQLLYSHYTAENVVDLIEKED